jgi:hypothetical protein
MHCSAQEARSSQQFIKVLLLYRYSKLFKTDDLWDLKSRYIAHRGAVQTNPITEVEITQSNGLSIQQTHMHRPVFTHYSNL